MLKLKRRLPQKKKKTTGAHLHCRTVGYSRLQRHAIATQRGMHLVVGGFPMGTQAFIRATKFMGLVAQLLKQEQPSA